MADHGKGREGLAQVVEGEAGPGGPFRYQQFLQAPDEPGIKGVFLRPFGGADEVLAFHGRKLFVAEIPETEADACRKGLLFEKPSQIRNRPSIARGVAIDRRAPQGLEMGGKTAAGTPGPAVLPFAGRPGALFKKIDQPFKVGIQRGHFDAFTAQGSAELSDARRRLGRFDDRRMDEEHHVPGAFSGAASLSTTQ